MKKSGRLHPSTRFYESSPPSMAARMAAFLFFEEGKANFKFLLDLLMHEEVSLHQYTLNLRRLVLHWRSY